MRIGTLCYATSRGLGHLARDFHRHGLITDVCVVRHPNVPTNEDWYPGAPQVHLRTINRDTVHAFARGLDAMLFFETPFDWSLIDWCREQKIRTYLVTMHECTPKHHSKPHRYLCPSLLDMEYFPDGVFLPLPVEYPWRLRERAEVYVHNGGYLGLRGREGTTLLIEAMAHVKSPLKLILRCQENVRPEYQRLMARDGRIDYQPGTIPYPELYATGDVVVQPQKFNGCSLPLQEACASGMLVMTTDRFPMNTWLPKAPLIPVAKYQTARIGGPYLDFQEAQIRPEAIAATMDAWFEKDIAAFSESGREWAESMSWAALGPKWRETLAS